jgi:hypothetical protein
VVLVLDAMPRSACCKADHRGTTLLLMMVEGAGFDIVM